MAKVTTLDDLIGIEYSKLGFYQDLRLKIDELQAAHRQSEQQRQEIAAILDGITDIMMVLSHDLRIIAVNHIFHEIFDVPHPEGRHCYGIFRNGRQPCPECPAHKAFRTNAVCRERGIFKLGGVNRQFEMVASPIRNPDNAEGLILIFKRDVTLEKEYQAKFYQAEKMATIGMLAAGVAHEINNPLTAIFGFAEGIKRRLPAMRPDVDPDLFTDMEDYIDTILQECRRCRDIVRALLTFSRPFTSGFNAVCLNAAVTDTLRLLRHHMKGRGADVLKLSVNLEETLPAISGDEAQLKQVMLNLLVNAMDAVTGPGEITITTRREGQGWVSLSVEDSGCGIRPENMDKLFDPFFTTKPVGKGIGIGLATCYNIVKEHGGTIEVVSEVGQGTRFTVKLPLAAESADD